MIFHSSSQLVTLKVKFEITDEYVSHRNGYKHEIRQFLYGTAWLGDFLLAKVRVNSADSIADVVFKLGVFVMRIEQTGISRDNTISPFDVIKQCGMLASKMNKQPEWAKSL